MLAHATSLKPSTKFRIKDYIKRFDQELITRFERIQTKQDLEEFIKELVTDTSPTDAIESNRKGLHNASLKWKFIAWAMVSEFYELKRVSHDVIKFQSSVDTLEFLVGSETCFLCKRYLLTTPVGCNGCPLANYTGSYCRNVWSSWRTNMDPLPMLAGIQQAITAIGSN